MLLRSLLILNLLIPTIGKSNSEHRLVGRILSVSDSKKTILFNRGKEDGLKLEVHAKFSLPEGILARAVLVRISPGRSVWSIYKFYKKEKILKNIIVTVKTTPPLKLTPDSSKAIDIPDPDSNSWQEPTTTKLTVTQAKKEKKMIPGFNKVDYSSLDDSGKLEKLDPAVDWNNLHNLQKPKKQNPNIDFSNLH